MAVDRAASTPVDKGRWLCHACGQATDVDPALWRTWCEGTQSTFHDPVDLWRGTARDTGTDLTEEDVA